ncbi:hypothetical protein [Bacillus cereus]|nr:hypothetical protein [Bacillus cereus]
MRGQGVATAPAALTIAKTLAKHKGRQGMAHSSSSSSSSEVR